MAIVVLSRVELCAPCWSGHVQVQVQKFKFKFRN